MKGSAKKIIAMLLCIVMLLPLCACAGDSMTKQIFAMDTVISLVAYGNEAASGLSAAAGVIDSMNAALDPDLPSSYTSKLNAAEGEEVPVSSQVYEMLSTAMDVCQRSGGALDLSVYPLYLAWGEFKEETGRIPDNDEILELRKTMKFSKATLTDIPGENEYFVKLPAETQLSFGAVAKGCASQYAIDAMRAVGVKSAIVSLGGNVQTLGKKPDGKLWTVAVEDPSAPGTNSYIGTLQVGETAIVTSGSYQRYFIGSDGVKYHHIIDPSTGKPVDNELVSVTIVCEDGTLADCLSTAMFVLGEKKAIRYWRDNGGFDMILVSRDGRVTCTKGLIETFTLTNTSDYQATFVE